MSILLNEGLGIVWVMGREKHLYSIYRKKRDKGISFREIHDVCGFRVITRDLYECYKVLAVLQQLYRPMSRYITDYIACPKMNGYQALHQFLFGPGGVPIEIQIRTVDMDRQANNGVAAAHWLYKARPAMKMDKSYIIALRLVHGLLEVQQRTGNSLEFIENVKIDLFPDEIYVFTPRGDILELPKGSTVVDFAYAVHTDVGNTCVAAQLDHRRVPLSTVLLNGQTIDIITEKKSLSKVSMVRFCCHRESNQLRSLFYAKVLR